MDTMLETVGVWLASAHAFYGLAFLLLPAFTFAHVPVMAASVWVAVAHARGRRPFPAVPRRVRRGIRLALEVAAGLVNPVVYLLVLAPVMLRTQRVDWGLTPVAWVLLVIFWSMRLGGATFQVEARSARLAARAVLVAGLACVLAHGARDLWVATQTMRRERLMAAESAFWFLRFAPLYLVPAVLLTDYLAASRERNDEERCTWRALFVLPGAAARVFVVAAILVAAGSAAATLHRRSDANVRALVVSHRASIVAASDRYGVDPRLQPVPAKVTARLRLENKGRGGKSVTVVDGLPDNAPFLDELLKAMKRACATGGTTRPGALELAGDVRERLRSLLRERAIAVKG